MECVPILICHLSNTRIPKHALARIFLMTHQPSANESKRPNTNQTYELPLPTFNFKTASFPPRSSTSKITLPSTIHPTIFCIFSQCCFRFPKGLVVVPVIYNTCGMTWTGSVAVWHASWRPKTRRRQLFGKPWRTVGEGHGVPPGAPVYLGCFCWKLVRIS